MTPAPTAGLGPLLDLAPIGIVLTTADGTVLAANPHAERITGPTAGGTAVTLRSVFPGQEKQVDAIFSGTATAVGDVTLRREVSGVTRFIEATATPVRDDAGPRFLVLLNDVTDRVEAERQVEAARHSLDFQRSLLESQSEALLDAVLVVGRDGKTISFNRRFVEMWDIPGDVIEGSSGETAIEAIASRVTRPEVLVQRTELLDDDPSEEGIDELVLTDGRTIQQFTAPVIGESGGLLGRMWFFRDVTETRRREQTLSLLAAATEAASATTDVIHNIQAIGELVVEQIADVCLVYLVDDEGTVDRVELSDRDPEREAYLRDAVRPFSIDPDKQEGVAKVLRDGQPILATHASAEMMAADVSDPDGLLEIIGKLGIESWICVPLQARHEIIGAISMVSLDPAHRYGPEDLELAGRLARRVSLGIQAVRFGERERKIAETLQRSLLPQTLPDIPGLKASSHYVAGSTGMDVGGDWFEMVQLPGKKVLAVIGDVAGKGLRAAAVMGEIRMALRAYSMETTSPAELLDRLNRLLMQGDEFQMATVLCAVIDLRAQKVSFVTAGHPPPLLLSAEGEARFLEGGLHPPLGVPLSMHSEAEHDLPPGSTLLLYTDGAVERRDRHIDEGLEMMRRLVESSVPDPSALCANVVASAIGGQEHSDDVAVLCLQIPPTTTDDLRIEATAEPIQLKKVRSSLERWLVGHETPAELVDNLVLAVNEACANAIEHAYGPGEGSFTVEGRVDSGSIVIEVSDTGRWRQPVASEQGRGISLMQSLVEDVEIVRTAGGTVVRLRTSLDASGPDPRAQRKSDRSDSRTDAVARVALSGEIDLARSNELTKSILQQVSNEHTGLVLDLSSVTYIDSSGLRMLFTLQKKLEQRRQSLTVVVPEDSPLRRMLELGGVGAAVTITPEA